MNWDAIGAIGELVGALIVVLTLAYLVIEVRRNRLSTESSAVESTRAGLNWVNANTINNREHAELWVKGFADPDSLDDVQSTRFWFIAQSYLNQYAATKIHYDGGALPEEEW